MASILLVISIGTMGLIVFWYVFDEAARGGEGKSGFLAMHDFAEAARKNDNGSGWKRAGNSTPWRIKR